MGVIPTIDKLSISTAKLTLQYKQEGEEPLNVSTDTGFFWKCQNQTYLITNWHLVTGRHFETKKTLHSQGSIPNQLIGEFFIVDKHDKVTKKKLMLPLYHNEQKIWLEHPGEADVVAIPLNPDIILDSVVAANAFEMDLVVSISQDAFILGYPKGISVLGLPIWKRGSIASELQINAYLNKPTFLLDTATREGMSGAPVYAVPNGPYKNNQGTYNFHMGIEQKFIGIYSGRLGDNEFEAQLGIVWKKEIIDEITEPKTLTTTLTHLHASPDTGK